MKKFIIEDFPDVFYREEWIFPRAEHKEKIIEFVLTFCPLESHRCTDENGKSKLPDVRLYDGTIFKFPKIKRVTFVRLQNCPFHSRLEILIEGGKVLLFSGGCAMVERGNERIDGDLFCDHNNA